MLGNRRSGISASKNAVKYYQKLRKKHKKISNIREDFLQKTTTLLAKTYQHILVEDLNVKAMMANHKLSNALSNLGLYRFRELLSYKQECFGFLLTIVDRWFPSSKSGCDPAPSYGESTAVLGSPQVEQVANPKGARERAPRTRKSRHCVR